MLNRDRNKDSKKKINRSDQKKKQLCTCSTLFCTFLCCCFARLQHRTSWLHILQRKCCMFVCGRVHFFFSLPLIFTLVAASISHFLTPAIKFSCFSSNEICLLCFLSLALALSLLSTSVCMLQVKKIFFNLVDSQFPLSPSPNS